MHCVFSPVFESLSLIFFTTCNREEMEVHKMSKKPLCMNQYARIFAGCRVPGKDVDKLKIHFKPCKLHLYVVYGIRVSQIFLEVSRTRASPVHEMLNPDSIPARHKISW